MKPLSLQKSSELYTLLKPYLPEEKGLEILYYIGIIISRIAAGDKDIYVQALELMVGQSRDTLLRLNGDELYKLFVDGIISNRLPELQSLMQGLEV